ncbi:MAG: hypothetical protein QGG14_05195 [Planctomycetota bacterium]|nr:hypothetical protein [Planctomycetota bacterium]
MFVGCSDTAPDVEKHDNGKKKAEGYRLEDGTKVGRWTYWDEKGQKRSEGEHKNGELEGLWTFWHANGKKRIEGEFKSGQHEGLWTYWDEDGSIKHDLSGIYKANKKVAPLPKK